MKILSPTLSEPLYEITGGRMDLSIRLIERAATIAATRGDRRLLRKHFEAAVDWSSDIVPGPAGNPFRCH
jgi:hypothetical protein